MYIAMQNLRANAIKDSKHEDVPCENSKNHCKETGKYSLMRKFRAHVSLSSVVDRSAKFNTVDLTFRLSRVRWGVIFIILFSFPLNSQCSEMLRRLIFDANEWINEKPNPSSKRKIVVTQNERKWRKLGKFKTEKKNETSKIVNFGVFNKETRGSLYYSLKVGW